jgi:Spy/CpxP family protein refolding chaperone
MTMHPGFIHWWKEAQRAHDEQRSVSGCGATAGCAPGWRRGRSHGPADHEAHFSPGGDDGAGFGVRRPLRFMAWKLELSEVQIEQLAGVLDGLKTERAQAAVDHRRSVGSIADALSGDTFDVDAATAAVTSRVESAERLKGAVLDALKKTHGLLTPNQRKQLTYLLRSGQLSI